MIHRSPRQKSISDRGADECGFLGLAHGEIGTGREQSSRVSRWPQGLESKGRAMAYRGRIIGDAMLLATLAFIAAIILGAL